MGKELKALLFDMGGTLLEFENHTWEELGRMGTEAGYGFLQKQNITLPSGEEFFASLKDETIEAFNQTQESLEEFEFKNIILTVFNKYEINTSDGTHLEFLKAYYQPITDQISLIEGAPKILEFFKQRGLKIGLVSNTIYPARFHREELERFGLLDFFDQTWFSSEVGYRKPHSRIFSEALQGLGVFPEETVFIGDRPVEDVKGAQRVGIKGILRYKPGSDSSSPVTPDAKINDLRKLPHVIFDLFNKSISKKEID